MLHDNCVENKEYLTRQIITCIGNKRSLLQFIARGIEKIKRHVNKSKLALFDVFSGSGVVARSFKRHADLLVANDLEHYSRVINECYLSNRDELDMRYLRMVYDELIAGTNDTPLRSGILTELYAPRDDRSIQAEERVFYTHRNAMYIDTVRGLIEGIDKKYQPYFLAPLLAEASVHSNTAGLFKGFYKNKETGIGQFGGAGEDALVRIKGDITLPFPVFSNFCCDFVVLQGDANVIIKEAPEVDAAYMDPPYNQHPYGSNYFMLNLIVENKYPKNASAVSGIPDNWNRSAYNKKQSAYTALADLTAHIKAKYVLISFNSEGFISQEEMRELLEKIGKVEVLETEYPAFRGSRNLANRNTHVREYLYVVEKL